MNLVRAFLKQETIVRATVEALFENLAGIVRWIRISCKCSNKYNWSIVRTSCRTSKLNSKRLQSNSSLLLLLLLVIEFLFLKSMVFECLCCFCYRWCCCDIVSVNTPWQANTRSPSCSTARPHLAHIISIQNISYQWWLRQLTCPQVSFTATWIIRQCLGGRIGCSSSTKVDPFNR